MREAYAEARRAVTEPWLPLPTTENPYRYAERGDPGAASLSSTRAERRNSALQLRGSAPVDSAYIQRLAKAIIFSEVSRPTSIPLSTFP